MRNSQHIRIVAYNLWRGVLRIGSPSRKHSLFRSSGTQMITVEWKSKGENIQLSPTHHSIPWYCQIYYPHNYGICSSPTKRNVGTLPYLAMLSLAMAEVRSVTCIYWILKGRKVNYRIPNNSPPSPRQTHASTPLNSVPFGSKYYRSTMFSCTLSRFLPLDLMGEIKFHTSTKRHIKSHFFMSNFCFYSEWQHGYFTLLSSWVRCDLLVSFQNIQTLTHSQRIY